MTPTRNLRPVVRLRCVPRRVSHADNRRRPLEAIAGRGQLSPRPTIEDYTVVTSKIKIGVFTFSPSAAKAIQNVVRAQFTDVDLQLMNIGLEQAIPVAHDLVAQGVEVIVSRRGTATLLRESLQVPIIAFPVTSIDILAAIRMAAQFGKKILIPCFRKTIRGLEIVEDLLEIQLIQSIYYDSKSLDETFVQASNQGCQVAVGGGVTKSFSQRHHFKVIEIRTSEEEIYSTLENARSVAQSSREERKKLLRFHQVLDGLSEGVMAVDQSGQVIIVNKKAKMSLETMNGSKGRTATAPFIATQFQKVMESAEPLLNRVESIKGVQYVVNCFPIMMDSEVIGAVSTFKDIDNVVKAENALRQSWAKGLVSRHHIDNLIHKNPVMQDVVKMAKRFAATDSTILITGETGTGKEILAQSIHNLSPRYKKPFVSLNCASLSDHLIESELFGYEQGAFTGAQKGGKPGLFEVAHTGSIFLDEISATPENVQTSLLRVLEQREVRRVGGDRLIPVDLRVISASNTNLAEEVHRGKFRSDLFYRLNVLNIAIPPLRERRSDIPFLLEYFIQHVSAQHRIAPLIIPPVYQEIMMQYPWPGNVRQLRNFVERLILLCDSRFNEDVFEFLNVELLSCTQVQTEPTVTNFPLSLKEESVQAIRDCESRALWQALVLSKFSKKEAARVLGMSRTTFWRKLKRANIDA
jgi:propionate catabolism operon transcriptional regulator